MKQFPFVVVALLVVACEGTGPTAPDRPVFRPTTPTTTTTTTARLTAAECNPTDVSRDWHGWNAAFSTPAILYKVRFEKLDHQDCADLDIYVRVIVTQGGNVYRNQQRVNNWNRTGLGTFAGSTCGGQCRVSVPSRAAYRISYRWQASFRENDWPSWPDTN